MTDKYKYIAKKDGIYKFNDNEKVSTKEIKEELINILNETIKENQPHIFIYEERPFINQYNGNISIDYSGRVELADLEDILELESELKDLDLGECRNYYTSKLAKLLDKLHTGQNVATYVSNHGLHWITYSNQIEDNIRDWVFQNTLLPHEDESNYDEAVDMLFDFSADLYSVLQETLKTIDYKEILNEIINSTM